MGLVTVNREINFSKTIVKEFPLNPPEILKEVSNISSSIVGAGPIGLSLAIDLAQRYQKRPSRR